jgi:DNA-directed RNA polymerase subunit M/transcription elongation factor TFIIS
MSNIILDIIQEETKKIQNNLLNSKRKKVFNLFYIPHEIDINKEYHINRKRTLLLIYTILNKYLDIEVKNFQEIIINIELSTYKQTIIDAERYMYIIDWNDNNFYNLYNIHTCRITKNLEILNGNKNYLIESIINKKINPLDVASLTSNQLCPSKSKKIIEELHIRSQQEVRIKTSTLYKCHKCSKKRVKIQIFQGRSLDEGSTISITCTLCQHKWLL